MYSQSKNACPKGWKENKLTGVAVMRKHTNGNITAGLYNIDLLCLGIKSTRYCLNMPQEEFLAGIGDISTLFEEIDYVLAHNIIYTDLPFSLVP